MTKLHKQERQPQRDQLKRTISSKEQRKIRARLEGDRSAWFGLGMFGLVGWSIVVPALIGIAFGAWLDMKWPSQFSWKITFLFVGVIMGFVNAYWWMNRENEKD